jgi:hypothetical protein
LTILIFPISLPNPFICSAFFITKLERLCLSILFECGSVTRFELIISFSFPFFVQPFPSPRTGTIGWNPAWSWLVPKMRQKINDWLTTPTY